MKDGRELGHREHVNRGASDRPLSEEEIVAKFMENAATALSVEAAQRVQEAVLGMDGGCAAHELSTVLAGRR